MRRKKLAINPTVAKMAIGILKFRRRLEVPMWHQDHLRKVARMFREYADRIDAVANSNEMRASDKTTSAQQLLLGLNSDLQRMTPTDPRERGAERGGYNHDFGTGYLNTNGFDELLSRDDMKD